MKWRKIAGWVLSGLLGALFLFSGAMKFTQSKQIVEGFEKFGLAGRIPLIATGEVVSAILFLIPKTHPLGVLLLSGYMGGAIATHMEHGEPFVTQSVFLLLIWVAGFLRRPWVLIDPPTPVAPTP